MNESLAVDSPLRAQLSPGSGVLVGAAGVTVGVAVGSGVGVGVAVGSGVAVGVGVGVDVGSGVGVATGVGVGWSGPTVGAASGSGVGAGAAVGPLAGVGNSTSLAAQLTTPTEEGSKVGTELARSQSWRRPPLWGLRKANQRLPASRPEIKKLCGGAMLLTGSGSPAHAKTGTSETGVVCSLMAVSSPDESVGSNRSKR